MVGLQVRQARVPAPYTVVLTFADRTDLVIESFPCPRLHTIVDRPTQPPSPLSFQGLLRARLHGPLQRLELIGDDRVVELGFATGTLHARLFGRGGGIWWVQDGRVIAGSHGPAAPELPALPPAAPNTPPRFGPLEGSWDLAARAWLGGAADNLGLEAVRQHARRGLARVHKRLRRLRDNLVNDLKSAEGAGRLREDADCLAAALHRVRRGASEVEVDDLFNPGTKRTLPLDPRVDPSRTLGKMYDKAGRLDRSIDQILERLEATEARVHEVEADRVTAADADLAALEAIIARHGFGPPGTPARQDEAPPTSFRRWWGPGGEEVLVGRSDTENHQLTVHDARGRDWWFHLRNEPGAHVVLRGDKRHAPPLPTLLAVAQIVLRQARVAEGDSRDVQYARVKDLRAIPGAALGRVAVTHERVLHVTRDDEPLQGWVSGPQRPAVVAPVEGDR